ncbi:hypothetical protein EON63_03470 [archaeon]|nr:MAG: hypothetical protein EON63_03470 [archaeon]
MLAACSLCLSPTPQVLLVKSFMSSAESTWRLVSTAMLVPMLLEFLIDEIVWFLYPTLRTHAKEDPISHFIIMISLLPTSLLPLWIVEDMSIQARNVILSLGKLLTMYGVLGKAFV